MLVKRVHAHTHASCSIEKDKLYDVHPCFVYLVTEPSKGKAHYSASGVAFLRNILRSPIGGEERLGIIP